MRFISFASSSRGNAYLLEAEGVAPLLLEAGLPIKRLREKLRENGVSLSDLAGCLISNEHGDHAKAVKDLLKSGIDCYMSFGTAYTLGIHQYHRSHLPGDIPPPWRVIPFPLQHDAAEPTGFFVAQGDESLLFIPETEFLENRFKGASIIAIEANYQEEILHENIVKGHLSAVVGRRVRRHHLSLKTVKDFLLANDLSRCREIHLLHLSSGNSNEETMRKEIQETTGIPVYIAEE